MLNESIMFSFTASLISIIVIIIIFKNFSSFTGAAISIDWHQLIIYLSVLLGAGLIIGIIGGLYPSSVLSQLRPTTGMKGTFFKQLSKTKLNNLLTVIQFAFASLVMLSTIIIFAQFRYLYSKDLGYNYLDVIKVNLHYSLRNKLDVVKNELRKNNNILEVTSSASIGTASGYSTTSVTWEGKSDDREVNFLTIPVEYDYFKTFDIRLKEGRLFSKEFPSDAHAAYVLNEEAVKQMGLKSPLGTRIYYGGHLAGEIIGVVEDFHYKPLYSPIEPMLFNINQEGYLNLFIKTQSDDFQKTISYVQNTIDKLEEGNERPFQYSLLEDDYQSTYAAEEKISNSLIIFSILSLIISSLGLFTISYLSLQKRTKEVGIRKVMGAKASTIFYLISKDFLKLIVLASVISFPLGFYLAANWLQSFSYRINIGYQYFLITLLIMISTGMITILYNIIKLSLVNPINVLRDE